MAKEKTYTQLVDEAHYKSHLDLAIPVHGSKKYKKEGKHKSETDKFIGTELRSGSRIIAVESRNKNPIYMLCTVIDFQEAHSRWWGDRTELIVQVNKVSQDSRSDQIERLRTVSTFKGWGFLGMELVEIGKRNWDKYIPSGTN